MKINIRQEINKIENKHAIEKINREKIWFFGEKTLNITEKIPVKLIFKKAQISGIKKLMSL